MKKPPLSVAIITYNEEDIIARTLESVKDIASEIVIVDACSTDRTREIARAYGAKVYVEEWKGFASQKNSALSKCGEEWILCIDADEVVSEELKESLLKELRNPEADGYLINRRTFYLGDFLKHTWQPEWRLRLVRRSSEPRWTGMEPHDRLEVRGRVKKLKGDLLHYSYRSLEDQVRKLVRYALIMSEEMHKSGRRFRVRDMVLRPVWAFLKVYLLKRGFMDGSRGFVAAVFSAFYTFLKYAFLLERELKERLGNEVWRPVSKR
ncbi:MAG: glycosyltransferase family 2 protein [Aquificota bacterium]|nr:glycosyltransferase family 2 protein [Aquificota bacterium]